jgi:hypothetical protein
MVFSLLLFIPLPPSLALTIHAQGGLVGALYFVHCLLFIVHCSCSSSPFARAHYPRARGTCWGFIFCHSVSLFIVHCLLFAVLSHIAIRKSHIGFYFILIFTTYCPAAMPLFITCIWLFISLKFSSFSTCSGVFTRLLPGSTS